MEDGELQAAPSEDPMSCNTHRTLPHVLQAASACPCGPRPQIRCSAQLPCSPLNQLSAGQVRRGTHMPARGPKGTAGAFKGSAAASRC